MDQSCNPYHCDLYPLPKMAVGNCLRSNPDRNLDGIIAFNKIQDELTDENFNIKNLLILILQNIYHKCLGPPLNDNKIRQLWIEKLEALEINKTTEIEASFLIFVLSSSFNSTLRRSGRRASAHDLTLKEWEEEEEESRLENEKLREQRRLDREKKIEDQKAKEELSVTSYGRVRKKIVSYYEEFGLSDIARIENSNAKSLKNKHKYERRKARREIADDSDESESDEEFECRVNSTVQNIPTRSSSRLAKFDYKKILDRSDDDSDGDEQLGDDSFEKLQN